MTNTVLQEPTVVLVELVVSVVSMGQEASVVLKISSQASLVAVLREIQMLLVKVTIFITDLDYFSTVNDAMIAAFDGLPYPARSCVVVADLPKHGLVEVEAVAAL